MKKSVRQVLLVMVLMITLLLITSCNNEPAAGERPLDTAAALKAAHTGTEGVEINVLPDYPPALLYDQNELISIVEVKNRGAHNLEAQDCFIQITGVDPNIIGGDFSIPRACTDNLGTFEGKNVYNTEGGINQLEFRAANVALPDGVFEYNPTLNYLSCYTYHTKANPSVCVDPLFYQVTSEQKTCKPQNVAMAGGQAAPVGVSYVGVNMVGSKAIFEINVRNFGTGRVLSPYADIRSCGEASLEYTDLDKVAYSVELSGGTLIDCKPHDGFVRLHNEQGKIVCSFNVFGASAFETPLLVDLDYGYIASQTKKVKIIRTPE